MYQAYQGLSGGWNEPVWRFRTMSGLVRQIAGRHGTYSVVRSNGGPPTSEHQDVEFLKPAPRGENGMQVVARLLVPNEAIDADR